MNKETRVRALAVMLAAVVGIGMALLVARPSSAQQKPGAGYRPALIDIMNGSMQVHHTKLWFAGHADNWKLADLEVNAILSTIKNIEAFDPRWQRKPVAMLAQRLLIPRLDAVQQAIKEQDPKKFKAAYVQLTGACNSCHKGVGRPEISIMVPPPQGAGSYADQQFAPASDNASQ